VSVGWLAWLAGVVLAGSPGSPVPVTRDAAQAAARAELSKGAYHRDDPSLPSRVIRWMARRFADAVAAAARHSPGGGIGLLVIVVVIGALVALVWVRVGGVRRAARVERPLLGAEIVSAGEHRRRADAFARDGRWPEAVREWLRATTRELEERGVLEPRPGRTAAELSAEASASLPAVADDLRRATSVFDAIWYGGATASSDDERLLRQLDERVAGSHRSLVGQP